MDVQHLDFPDHTFDAVVAACVFCSVPDPVAGTGKKRSSVDLTILTLGLIGFGFLLLYFVGQAFGRRRWRRLCRMAA